MAETELLELAALVELRLPQELMVVAAVAVKVPTMLPKLAAQVALALFGLFTKEIQWQLLLV
jgi:hypothetical protein